MNRLVPPGVKHCLRFTLAGWLDQTAACFNDRVTIAHDGLEIAL